ncbi:MAG: MrtC family glutamic-type intramembrane protease [Myxococcales bacterium]|nr:MrtC family glutamic-type intramembrane protease [Myxococcales bacterium]MDD9969943.1 MrtC family glutamic-type intramembrane protease [Myxococcales bacterium]
MEEPKQQHPCRPDQAGRLASPAPARGPSQAPPGARAPAAREVALAYLGITLATVAIDRFTRLPGLGNYTQVALALLFLVTAIQLAQRSPGGLAAHGLELGGLLEPAADEPRRQGPLGALFDLAEAVFRALPSAAREIRVALMVSAVIFPPFCLGFYLFHQPTHPFTFHLPADLFNYGLSQLLVVGLPEEALFRGYFQTRLAYLFPGRRRLFWAHVSVGALVAQAALFALLHFAVDLNPVRLAVFFPGLLFGWARAWRGGIGAAIVLHALSNLLSDILVRGWL